MLRREVHVGLGVLILAVALALPAFVQTRFGGLERWGTDGGWMMGNPYASPDITPVTSIDAAADRARETLAMYGGDDLMVAEVMEFSNHFYVLVKEKATGVGAVELIVERTGIVHPEPGPNMMWNAKYGHMAGGPAPSAQPITEDRAKQIASQYLARFAPAMVVDKSAAFYG